MHTFRPPAVGNEDAFVVAKWGVTVGKKSVVSWAALEPFAYRALNYPALMFVQFYHASTMTFGWFRCMGVLS